MLPFKGVVLALAIRPSRIKNRLQHRHTILLNRRNGAPLSCGYRHFGKRHGPRVTTASISDGINEPARTIKS
jgi:hypothetical protein